MRSDDLKLMKIGYLSTSLSRKLGGIFEIECALAHELQRHGFEMHALGLDDEEWQHDRERWRGIHARVYPVQGPASFGYSSGLMAGLKEADVDLLHLHALWMYPSVATIRWAKGNRRPYGVTPNGMLEGWALANSRWKKRLAGLVYERSMLRGAAFLQANTAKELRDFRSYGLRNPVAIIPNGVALPEIERVQTGRRMLLFLGRLHPKKGLVNALKAWASARSGARSDEGWQLAVAGWDQGGHEAELKQVATECGLRWADVPAAELAGGAMACDAEVCFAGPAFGETKDALLRRADAFILPSFSEGLPMSVLEAWAYRLPVLMTDHCNLPEGFAAGAARRIGTDAESIASGMRDLFGASDADLREMGGTGRALVESRYTWPQVAAQMAEVYRWVLGDGLRPAFVELE